MHAAALGMAVLSQCVREARQKESGQANGPDRDWLALLKPHPLRLRHLVVMTIVHEEFAFVVSGAERERIGTKRLLGLPEGKTPPPLCTFRKASAHKSC